MASDDAAVLEPSAEFEEQLLASCVGFLRSKASDITAAVVEAADGVEAVKERVVEVERAASRRPERAVVGRVCGESIESVPELSSTGVCGLCTRVCFKT